MACKILKQMQEQPALNYNKALSFMHPIFTIVEPKVVAALQPAIYQIKMP